MFFNFTNIYRLMKVNTFKLRILYILKFVVFLPSLPFISLTLHLTRSRSFEQLAYLCRRMLAKRKASLSSPLKDVLMRSPALVSCT